MTAPTLRKHRRVDLLVVAVAGFLLLSMGGAIVAAPLTVPLLGRVARHHPRRLSRGGATAIAALTVAEVAWAIVYLAAGESRPWIWVVPLVAAGAATVTILRGRPASAREPTRAAA